MTVIDACSLSELGTDLAAMNRCALRLVPAFEFVGLVLCLACQKQQLDTHKPSTSDAAGATTHLASGSASAVAPSAVAAPSASPAEPVFKPVCPRFDKGREAGRIKNTDLKEASGLAVSRQNPGIIWSHNDTSARPRLFAMLMDGTNLGTYTLQDVDPVDWEDIALSPAADAKGWDLYIGDLGNNSASRSELTLYRVKEPKVERDQKPKNRHLRQVARFKIAYPNQQSHDAETLLVDPISHDVYVVTKGRNEKVTLYRAKAPLLADQVNLLEELITPSGLDASPHHRDSFVTGGSVSDDGTMVVVRTYKEAFLWLRNGREDLGTTLGRPACPLKLRRESQGEAIAFMTDGKGYLTLSEGERSRIFFFDRKNEE